MAAISNEPSLRMLTSSITETAYYFDQADASLKLSKAYKAITKLWMNEIPMQVENSGNLRTQYRDLEARVNICYKHLDDLIVDGLRARISKIAEQILPLDAPAIAQFAEIKEKWNVFFSERRRLLNHRSLGCANHGLSLLLVRKIIEQPTYQECINNKNFASYWETFKLQGLFSWLDDAITNMSDQDRYQVVLNAKINVLNQLLEIFPGLQKLKHKYVRDTKFILLLLAVQHHIETSEPYIALVQSKEESNFRENLDQYYAWLIDFDFITVCSSISKENDFPKRQKEIFDLLILAIQEKIKKHAAKFIKKECIQEFEGDLKKRMIEWDQVFLNKITELIVSGSTPCHTAKVEEKLDFSNALLLQIIQSFVTNCESYNQLIRSKCKNELVVNLRKYQSWLFNFDFQKVFSSLSPRLDAATRFQFIDKVLQKTKAMVHDYCKTVESNDDVAQYNMDITVNGCFNKLIRVNTVRAHIAITLADLEMLPDPSPDAVARERPDFKAPLNTKSDSLFALLKNDVQPTENKEDIT